MLAFFLSSVCQYAATSSGPIGGIGLFIHDEVLDVAIPGWVCVPRKNCWHLLIHATNILEASLG
jgi:hypothetical protein